MGYVLLGLIALLVIIKFPWILILVGIIMIPTAIKWWPAICNMFKSRQTRTDDLKLRHDDFVKNNGGKLWPIDTATILKPGEVAYLEEDGDLRESRAFRVSDSTGAGASFKGLHIGQSRSESHSFDELKDTDVGKITLTNKRLIFSGSLVSRSFKLDELTSVSISEDYTSINVRVNNRAKVQCFGVSNPYSWCAHIKWLVANPESDDIGVAQISVLTA